MSTEEPPAPPNELRHRRRTAEDEATPSGEDATETAAATNDDNLTGLDGSAAAMGTATPIPTRRKMTSFSINDNHHQTTMLTAKQVTKDEAKKDLEPRCVWALHVFRLFGSGTFPSCGHSLGFCRFWYSL
jgi:hypothetical protein